MIDSPSKPLQFGLKSLFSVLTFAAVMAWATPLHPAIAIVILWALASFLLMAGVLAVTVAFGVGVVWTCERFKRLMKKR